jgi:hypothetical protein
MTNIEAENLTNQISIRLFETETHLKQDLQEAIADSESRSVFAHNMVSENWGRSMGYLLGTTASPCEDNWKRLRNGSIDYFFVHVTQFVCIRSRLDRIDISVFICKELVMTRLETLKATHMSIFLTHAHVFGIETRVASLFPPASILDNFPHWRTYETVLAIVSF